MIKSFFSEKFTFYASGVNNKALKTQLKNFSDALSEYGLRDFPKPKDWLDAFKGLKTLLEQTDVYREPKSGKRVIFLDEIPWMDTKRSDFKAGLDLFWNTYASTKSDLILIVCGSATSWILKNMVKDEGGFYNRLTRKMHLLPFTLGECLLYSQYLKLGYKKKQVIECYMIFGGVPFYWEMLDPELSLAQNINKLFLTNPASCTTSTKLFLNRFSPRKESIEKSLKS